MSWKFPESADGILDITTSAGGISNKAQFCIDSKA